LVLLRLYGTLTIAGLLEDGFDRQREMRLRRYGLHGASFGHRAPVLRRFAAYESAHSGGSGSIFARGGLHLLLNAKPKTSLERQLHSGLEGALRARLPWQHAASRARGGKPTYP